MLKGIRYNNKKINEKSCVKNTNYKRQIYVQHYRSFRCSMD